MGVRPARVVIGIVTAIALLAGCGRGTGDGVAFSSVAFTVTQAGATTTAGRWCAYLADTEAERERGLMGRTDLAGRRGMLFRFPADTQAQFYMKDTPLPLSIAWFDAQGAFVSQADMKPCLAGEKCALYGADRPYRTALEVPSGGLPELAIGPGSVLWVGGTCDQR